MKTHFLTILLLATCLCTTETPLIAADAPPTKKEIIEGIEQVGQELAKSESQIITAIARKDEVKIAKLIKGDAFGFLAMTNPGGIIMAAVHLRNYKVLDALLENHANIDTTYLSSHSTALHNAVSLNDVEMVHYLLDHGSDAFRIDEIYHTPADRGLAQSKTDCVMAVLQDLKKKGLLETYLRWEETLLEVRTKVRPANPEMAKEKEIFFKIQNLAKQVKE